MRKLVYTSGDRYGEITLTGKAVHIFQSKSNRLFVECICECGKIWFTNYQGIRSGDTKSCGCKKKRDFLNMVTKHGKARTGLVDSIYSAWCAMKSRCDYLSNIRYENYGGRGVIVCDEWTNSFNSFYDWAVSNGWQSGLTLDRKNTNGNYEPSNCRWATHETQSRNKTTTVLLSGFGEIKCLKDWTSDERCVVGYGTVHRRINELKWPIEKAITEPAKYSIKWREKQLPQAQT